MKKLLIIYLSVFLPVFAIVYAVKNHYLSEVGFMWALGLYVLVYHPMISSLRLLNAGKISSAEIWKCFLPFYNWKYFSFLFFKLN
ncbi:MAG TPA: hypothetical protein VKR32_17930 [Puia sp.]|nr:hypothetical protein [Puia sp.]